MYLLERLERLELLELLELLEQELLSSWKLAVQPK
jgi:hypothetical protein